MRIGVISDIHGNAVGLEAVLADLRQQPVDTLVCLGDALQGGPQPAEVAARLRQLGCPVVMGNADAWLLTGEESPAEEIPEDRLHKMRAVRLWSLEQLTAEDRAYINGFRPTVEIALENGRSLLCFHGSPASFNDVIAPTTPQEEVQAFLGAYVPRPMCGGHTHVQFLRRLADTFFFNPGSVGLAYNHDQPADNFRMNQWAEYAVLTVDGPRLALEFRRVPYELAPLLAAYQTSGRPFAAEAAAQYG